jgi:hypothetical protein
VSGRVDATLDRQRIDELLQPVDGDSSLRELRLPLTIFDEPMRLTIELADAGQGVRPKTVQTIGDLLRMGPAQRQRLRELLHADAMRAADSTAYGEPMPAPKPRGLWDWLLRRPGAPFIAIERTSPRHPCHFIDGVNGVDAKVQYLHIELSEHHDELKQRFAILHCLPAWEMEHGAGVAIRNGEPVTICDGFLDLDVHDMSIEPAPDFRLSVLPSSHYLALYRTLGLNADTPRGEVGEGDMGFEVDLEVDGGRVPADVLRLADDVLSCIVELDERARAMPNASGIDHWERLHSITVARGLVQLDYHATAVNTEWTVSFTRAADGSFQLVP